MNFFCTKKHYDAWSSKKKVDEEIAFCLDAAQALAAARMIFRVDDPDLHELQRNP
jgi:hypothetical protein